MDFKTGDDVRLRAYGGQLIVRRVIKIEGRSIVVSTPEQCERAALEKREPICIGFPLSDVVAKLRRASPSSPKV